MHDANPKNEYDKFVKIRNASRLFDKYLKAEYPNYVKLRHHSDYSVADKEWIDESCYILKSHFQETKDKYGTLRFERYS